MISKFPIALLIVTLFQCNSPKDNPYTRGDERPAVDKFLHRYYENMSNRNWKLYRDHFWDNATITTVWQQPGDTLENVHVITIDEFIKETPNGPDSKPIFEERMTGSQIKINGNLAEAWATYEATFGSADSLMHWKGTDLFTLLRHNNEWKIVSLVFESRR